MLAETGFTVGREVLKVVVKTWLGLRKGETERQSQLIDLLAVSIRDVGLRRRIGLRFEDMAAQVSDRIAPFYEVEFRGLPEYEKRAALDAVVDTLSTADLSDAALFDAALSAPELARIARSKLAVERQEEFARRATGRGRKGRGLDGATFGLSTDAYELYLRVLDDTCLAMVKLLQQLPPFVPRATTELLKQVIDVGDRLDEVLSLLPRTSLDAPRGTAHDWEFHQAYVTHVSDKLDDLELFGMGSRGYRPRTRVSVAYLSLKVLDETPTGPTSTSGRDREDRRSVEATLARSPRTLVRGEAGSGKTTLLQWLAVNAARGSFVGPLHKWNNHVPVLIRLRSYAERDLPMGNRLILDEAAVLEDIVPDAWVRRQLASGRALLLVDGVDELPSKERSRVHAWLRDLTAEFREVPVVVTSRPNAAEATWLADLGFAGVLIEPMSNHDIELFCARWHDSVAQYARDGHAPWLPCPPAELPDYRRSLLRQLDSARHLRALATNPLLCAMLCTLNLGLRARLPLDRMQLYAEALTLLLQRRDDERGVVSPLDLRAKLAVLQYLAWSATLAGRSELARDDALIHVKHALDRMPEQHGSADEVLNHLLERSGVLREPVLGRVDFVHRTFQEYLAAKQAADEHRIDMLVRYSAEDEWRETVIMAAGHATERNRDRLLTGILDQATATPDHSRLLRLLAAAALDAGRTASPDVTARVTAEVA
ncbi:MAG: NACHT domain-containing protein, partial [Saccharothrix sp.]|nr:NACHT domain-containing protein [Saccharothrix sp.]